MADFRAVNFEMKCLFFWSRGGCKSMEWSPSLEADNHAAVQKIPLTSLFSQ
jgi:hypothetical protein